MIFEESATAWIEVKNIIYRLGKTSPCQGILLYGAPGTGKTYFVRSLATELGGSTFLHVSSADLISKWLIDSEMNVKNLFTLARDRPPSIIFIDDIDTLWSSCPDNESESSRRIKAEFHVQMDAVENDGILVITATSKPWVLDDVIRKRFEKHIYIPLPERNVRTDIFKHHFNNTKHSLTNEDYELLGTQSEGFSAADITIIARDAMMVPVRKIQLATHFKEIQEASPTNDMVLNQLYTPCDISETGAKSMNWMDIPGDKLCEPVISMEDTMRSLRMSKPTINEKDLEMLRKFTADFGEDG